jgi:CheY-like chemotaxis protein
VLGSRARLEQVFANLLVNAAQAIPEGSAAGNEVAVSVGTAPSGEVVAEVRDTGAGMTPEVRARIFEPFFTTRPVGAGAGLGLAICHGIVADLGGRIEVESEPGQGTTVRVVLPPMAPGAAAALPAVVAPTGPAAPAPAPPPADAWAALPPDGRVLLVDDDALIGKVVVRSLAGGPEVVALEDGREALRRLLAGERFDVVLCDLMMPDFSGMDLHAALQAARPDLAAQVIFVTGGAFTPRARDFLASVRNECLKKPFEPAALRRLVARRLAAARRAPGGGGGP